MLAIGILGQTVVPSAPTGLTAARAPATQVVLNWTDTSANETGFEIQRATDSGFTAGLTTFTTAVNATTFTNTVPSATDTYYFRVRAFNLVGNSVYTTVGPVLPPALLSYSIFPANAVPVTAAEPDAAAVELGMKFTSNIAGRITGIRYYPYSVLLTHIQIPPSDNCLI